MSYYCHTRETLLTPYFFTCKGKMLFKLKSFLTFKQTRLAKTINGVIEPYH